MVSMRDRALVEARARGIDPEQELAGHWRQMLRPGIAGPAFAVSVYLLLYYALVGNLVIYFSAVYGYSEQRANAVANWYWAANAVSLVVAGLISDRLKVRKPLMMVGCVGTIVTTAVFATLATHAHTGYYTFAVVFLIGGALAGVTYAPWMAAFTETVEERNPAATATGLAVWGWILRIVVAVSAAFVPVVVTSVTPVVDHGAEVAAAQAKAGPALAIMAQHPAVFAELSKYPSANPAAIPPAVLAQAVAQVGMADLQTVQQAQPELAILQAHGTEVAKAVKDGPHQWQTWWWVASGRAGRVPAVRSADARAVESAQGPRGRRGARAGGRPGAGRAAGGSGAVATRGPCTIRAHMAARRRSVLRRRVGAHGVGIRP